MRPERVLMEGHVTQELAALLAFPRLSSLYISSDSR
jgi:hypothetical protein